MRNENVRWIVAGVGLMLFGVAVVGCQQAAEEPRYYEFKASVTAVDPDNHRVTLDHEPIVGFMEAMHMEYIVDDPKMLAEIRAGDSVTGQVRVRSDGYWISRIEKR